MTIKIIWDFRGEDGYQTAKHHAIHLKEFCDKNQLDYQIVDAEKLNDFHTIAYIVTKKQNVVIIRDALKPHRAEVVV